MPLRVVKRKDTGSLTIVGTIQYQDGSKQRVRTRAQTNVVALAREEASTLEARLLREGWHGQRRGSRSLAEAVVSYVESSPRAQGTKNRLNRILWAVGDVPLSAISQETVLKAKKACLKEDASPATLKRGVITPLRSVMNHAHRLGWCDVVHFEIPRERQGRTRFLLPAEAEGLIAVASPHLQTLLTFLLCTGARMAEALELDWRDVDLVGGRAIFWETKGGNRRVAEMPRRACAVLEALGHREGPVFLTHRGEPYADRDREGGGQIKTAWKLTKRRAKIEMEFTPHDLRHTWASWHYAVHKDPLALKVEGGWSSLALVERYAHLMPAGFEDQIRAFRDWHPPLVLATAGGLGA